MLSFQGEILNAIFHRQVVVWDVSTQEILQTITCHIDMIYSLAVNRDGSYIATTSKDKKLRVIEPRTAIVISVSIEFNSNCIVHHQNSKLMLIIVFFSFLVTILGRCLSSRHKVLQSGIFRQR